MFALRTYFSFFKSLANQYTRPLDEVSSSDRHATVFPFVLRGRRRKGRRSGGGGREKKRRGKNGEGIFPFLPPPLFYAFHLPSRSYITVWLSILSFIFFISVILTHLYLRWLGKPMRHIIVWTAVERTKRIISSQFYRSFHRNSHI